MTTQQMIDKQFTAVKPESTIGDALELMQKYSCTHLPVVDKNNYKGLLDKKDILDPDVQDDTPISQFQNDLVPAAVNGSTHFLNAVPVANIYRTNVVPVINESEEYLGSITQIDLLNALGNFCGAGEYGAIIVLEIDKSKLNISELNSIIESDGATMLHYNLSPIAASSVMEVSIGVDKKEISTILATLTGYNYKILYTSGAEQTTSQLSENYNNLMNYLDM